MTMPEAVQLLELSTNEAQLLAKKSLSVSLGNATVERKLAQLRQEVQNGARAFLLDWEGSKIPRGVEICGHVINWTQHGNVSATGGLVIGTYDRIVEFGGESGEHQQMIIYIL